MQNIYELIIIGGGPAGITAGIYAARKKLNTLLLAKDFLGQTGKAWSIENFPGFFQISGPELMEKFKNHLKNFEIEIKEGEEVKKIYPVKSATGGVPVIAGQFNGVNPVKSSKGGIPSKTELFNGVKKKDEVFEVLTLGENKFQAKTVIVASGRNPRPLKVPGEERFMGKGVSFCSICDAPLFKGKTVAVVGGGNAGFETALDLARYSTKIYILEFSSRLKSDEVLQEKAKASGKISVITNAVVKEIKGKNFVESLVYEDKTANDTKELAVDGVFVEIGSLPATAFLGDLVDFNSLGEVKIDHRTGATKTSGFFAAGDVTDIRDKQIITACGEGARAALSAYEFLQKTDEGNKD